MLSKFRKALVASLLSTGCAATQPFGSPEKNDDDYLAEISNLSFKKLVLTKDDLSKLEEPYRTVAAVVAAQGVIDNGGYNYFFENDWPHQPSYQIFIDAYDRIGCTQAADNLRQIVASFGVKKPERDLELRRDGIDQEKQRKEQKSPRWPKPLYDEAIYKPLIAWARTQTIPAKD
jgi:hypothetical protein